MNFFKNKTCAKKAALHVRLAAAALCISAAMCAPAPAKAAAPPGSLQAAMIGQSRPSPAALGEWHYTITAEKEVMGNVTITTKEEKSVAGAMYSFSQTAEFYMGATESRRVVVNARMKPDLSLERYEKIVEIWDGARTVSIEKTTFSVGALTVAISKESGRKKDSKTFKKSGPVCYAFGAAFVFAHAATPKADAVYTFLSPSADGKSIGQGELRVTGATSASQGGVFISAAIGADVVVLRLDSSGNVVDYGPPSGDPRFVLSAK